MLEISLLGPLQIQIDGKPVDNLSSSKAQALLGYLAAENSQAHRRETLAGLLWPNYAESSARVNLRQTLKRLRQHIPPTTIHATRLEIGFNRDAACMLDFVTFTDGVTRYRQDGNIDDLKTIVRLYRGDFLAQLWLDDCAEFEEWLLLKREWLRREMLDALHQLTARALDKQQVDDALVYARQQVELDALSETALHQLIETLARLGRRTDALQQFARYRDLLADELATAPSATTVALVEQIRSGDLTQTNDPAQHQVPDGAPYVLSPRPNNLPFQSTPILGREREIGEVVSLLKSETARLITIVGPGGIGKTRLALAVAEQLVEEALSTTTPASISAHFSSNGGFASTFRGEPKGDIAFVPLQSVGNPGAIAPAIADAVNLRLDGNTAPQAQLRSYLQHKETFLLLDSFEHLLNGVDLITDLLCSCPRLRCLVTSRERLNLRQEQVFALDGLAWPTDGMRGAERYPAVDLFIQNARRVRHNFTVDDAGQTQIIALCQHVEGMPLALELAASWVNALPLTEIAQSVAQSLDALSSSARDLPDRHRNMRAVFDLTWQHMTEEGQQLFARLSVFRGGFTRAAAETVTGASMQQLALLINKSLVRYDAEEDRYSLHELLRQYGSEQLEAQPVEEANVFDRHSDYFCTWLGKERRNLETLAQPAAQTQYALEFDNITRAWEWAICNKYAAQLQNAVNSVGLLFMRMARYHEGANLFERATQQWAELSLDSVGDALDQYVYAQLLIWSGDFVHFLGQNDRANTLINRSLEILAALDQTALDTRRVQARGLYCLGDTVAGEEAQGCYEQALGIAQSIGDRWLEASALQSLSDHFLRESTGFLDEARAKAEQSLKIHREIGDPWGISWNLQHLGSIAADHGDIAAGRRAAEESLQIRQRLGMKSNVARSHSLYGYIAILAGDFDEAVEQYQQSLTIWQDLNLPTAAIHGECDLALSKLFAGRYAAAHQLMVQSLRYCRERSGLNAPVGRIHYCLGMLAIVEGAFADALQHVRIYSEEPPMPFQRPYVLSSLALAARGSGATADAQKHLDDALQIACQSPRYFATLQTLNAALLLLADAGEIEYARLLFDRLRRHPFNANSRWFADVIADPFEHALRTVSAVQESAPKNREHGRWIEQTKESCQILSSSVAPLTGVTLL